MDYFRVLAQMLQEQGRGNDTLLAHITPDEARLLKRRGGSGTRNPVTGLLEFYDSEGSSPDGGSSTSDSGGYGGGDSGYGGMADDGYGGGPSGSFGGGPDYSGLADDGRGGGPAGSFGNGYDQVSSSGGYSNDSGDGGAYVPPSAAAVAASPPPRQFGVDPGFLAQLARSQNIGVPQVTIASAPAAPFSVYLPAFPTLSLLAEPTPNSAPVAPVPALAPTPMGVAPMPPAVPMASRDLGASVSIDEFLRQLRGYL